MASVVCCEGFETITGEQSELGEVGTTLTGSFNGASDINVSVVSLDNGISTVAKKILPLLQRYLWSGIISRLKALF